MRRNYALLFNNINLSDFNCYYDGIESFKIPDKLVDNYSVVGLNGDLGISQNKYSNIDIPFNCHINNNFRQNFLALINKLSAVEGYARLEASEEPDVYRMAMFNNDVEPELWQNDKGTFRLIFNCKPQKWLKDGEIPIDITNTLTLFNPSEMTAKPLISVEGTGTITINSDQLTLATNTSTTYIDCEIQDAYEGTINRNPDLTITGDFPELVSGENTISVSGFTSCQIIPRWWRL